MLYFFIKKYQSLNNFNSKNIFNSYAKKKCKAYGFSCKETYQVIKYNNILFKKFKSSKNIYWMSKNNIIKRNNIFHFVLLKSKINRFICDGLLKKRHHNMFIVNYKFHFFLRSNFYIYFNKIYEYDLFNIYKLKMFNLNKKNFQKKIRILIFFPIQDVLYEL